MAAIRLVREGYIPDAENPSTVPASSRTSPLLQGTANFRFAPKPFDVRFYRATLATSAASIHQA